MITFRGAMEPELMTYLEARRAWIAQRRRERRTRKESRLALALAQAQAAEPQPSSKGSETAKT